MMDSSFKLQFAELLEKTFLPSNASAEESSRVWTAINELLFPNIPEKLFRFRKCNADNFIALQRGEITTCVAGAFSDKYDSLIFVDKKRIYKQFYDFRNSEAMELLLKLMDDDSIYPIAESVFGKTEVERIREENQLVSKEQRKQDFLAGLDKTPEEIIKRTQTHIDYLQNDTFTKIACFTENVHSLNMWDLYADGYKGFALEYDFRDFHFKGCLSCKGSAQCNNVRRNYSNLFPVIYSDKRYDATDNVLRLIAREEMQKHNAALQFLPAMDSLYWYKSYLYKNAVEYGHEKEWRIISRCPSYQDERFTNISDLGCLKAIYYGPFMETRYKDFLHDVAKTKGLQEYEMHLDSDSPAYEMEIKTL